MIAKTKLFNVFYWWKEIRSCFNSGDNVCVSGAFGVLSVFCLISSYVIISCFRCKLKRYCHAGHEAVYVLYSLIGNLCNVVGAFLSNQLTLQIIVASFMVAMDGLNFISAFFHVCLWYHSKMGTRVRMITRRRRQNLAVCLLFVMGGCVYLGKEIHHNQPLGNSSPTGRRLLSAFLHGRMELLGYVLGLLSFAISWTSRFPAFLSARRGELTDAVHVSSRALSAVGGALYASAVLSYDVQLESVVRALPWVLSGACAALLDTAILVLSCSRIRCSRQSAQQPDSATLSLLGSSCRTASGQRCSSQAQTVRKHPLFARKSSSANTKEMGHYMDINMQPVRKVCLKEVTLTGECSAESQPLKKSVKVVRVDERYSSDSATESSSLSSELQWDFEEATPPWGSGKAEGHSTEVFPLQEWLVDHKPELSSSSNSHTCFCNSAELKVVSASLDPNLSCSDSVK